MSRRFRNAVLELAAEHAFARPLVNSGRLSPPTPYQLLSLNTVDEDSFAGNTVPGHHCDDAPVRLAAGDGWFLNQIGDGLTVPVFGALSLAVVFGVGRVKLVCWWSVAISLTRRAF